MKEPFARVGLGKGVFRNQGIVALKAGTDAVVEKSGLNISFIASNVISRAFQLVDEVCTSGSEYSPKASSKKRYHGREPVERFIEDVAKQAALLRSRGIGVQVFTSGAVTYGRYLAGDENLEKRQAAHRGFDALMKVWVDVCWGFGLQAVTRGVVSEDLEYRNIDRMRFEAAEAALNNVFVANGDDRVNDDGHRLFKIVRNNDWLGKVVCMYHAKLYMMYTNVEGVLDQNQRVVQRISTLEQLRAIDFNSGVSKNGTGGMKIKAWAGAQFSLSSEGAAAILSYREKNAVERLLNGESIGTLISIRKMIH